MCDNGNIEKRRTEAKGQGESQGLFLMCRHWKEVADDVKKEGKLTPKQEAFVDAYIETGNATEAAKRAGYSEKTAGAVGAENLKKPKIKQAIEARQAEIHSERTADMAEIMEFLTSAMRGELTDENVVVEGAGDGISKARIIETRISSRDRLNAAQQLLKRFPRQMDVAEQEARIKRLASELESMEKANGVESVQIIDDLREDDMDDDDKAE
jgi:phage terminase small subunit